MIKLKKYRAYGLTAILTFISLLIMVYILKIYPFGDKTFLWADADQYFAIGHYFGSILGKNDIFYSWNNVLGGNALAQLAYYSFSPYNVIYLIFVNHMIFAAHLIAYLKIMSASLTFCYCLEFIYNNEEFIIKASLSMCYSFMGYMIFYGWNTSWMDGVILLPIIYIGIIKIAEKKNALQYIVFLGLAVISNFYIGFMLCIGSFALYVAVLLLQSKSFFSKLKETFIFYVGSSLIGVGLSSFILIPTYLALPESRKLTIEDMFENMYVNIKPIAIISGLFTGQVNSMDKNAPLVFVGLFPLVLAVVFFVCNKASIKKKMVYAALIITFMISFENSFLNKLWHGMSDNAWFNYRYSFFMSFILLLVSYEGHCLIERMCVSKNEFMKSGIILFIMASFVLNDAGDKIRTIAIYVDILFICIFVALLVMGFQGKRIFIVFVVLQMMYCSVLNGYYYLKDYSTHSRMAYGEKKSIMLEAKSIINDDSFYRMDKNFKLGRCDANLFNYNGVTNFASTENLDNLEFINKLGVRHSWKSGEYTTNMPEATETLLGIKYLLTDTINSKKYDKIGAHDNIQFYKNKFALPVLFPVCNIMEYDTDSMNDFELQNEMWKSINNINENVFSANAISDASVEGNKILSVRINKSGSAYLGIPSGSYTTIRVEGDNISKDISYDCFCRIYYLGELQEGSNLNLIFTTTDDNYNLDSITCYTEDKFVLEKNSNVVKNAEMSIDEISSSHLELSYEGNRGNVATTIPYDDGWKVYDNGKKLEIKKNWNNFLSFELEDADKHEIKLIYRPVGFYIGLRISIIAFITIIVYEVLLYMKYKKIK